MCLSNVQFVRVRLFSVISGVIIVKLEVKFRLCPDSKPTCLYPFPVDMIQMGKHSQKRSVNMISDLQRVASTCARLKDMLATVQAYVDSVIAGETPADSNNGRFLMDLVNSVPKINPEQFEEMLNSNMKVRNRCRKFPLIIQHSFKLTLFRVVF